MKEVKQKEKDPVINNNLVKIKHICNNHQVEKMYVIGSVVTENFSNSSDIDLLVKFKPMDVSGYFDNYLDLKNQLENIFQKDVDLIEEQTLKNPVLIRSINRSKKLIYG